MAVSLTDDEATALREVVRDWRATHPPVAAFSADLQSAMSKLALPVTPLNTGVTANTGTTVKVKGRDRA